MMEAEKVSEMTQANRTLTGPVAREDFVVLLGQ
jgi:hypothetical protein